MTRGARRAGMLLFCLVLAMAVFLESLRQSLSAHHVPRLRQRSPARFAALVGLTLCALLAGPARAEMLVSDTSLVSGTESSVFAFATPGPGTVTLELTDVNWPQQLSSLTFLVSAPNKVLSPWSSAGTVPTYLQLGSAGAYFADVTASAGGSLDLGVYSLEILFTPASSPVPLPASGGLLLAACLALLALGFPVRQRQTDDVSTRNEIVMYDS